MSKAIISSKRHFSCQVFQVFFEIDADGEAGARRISAGVKERGTKPNGK
jgi:hypothetical protein